MDDTNAARRKQGERKRDKNGDESEVEGDDVKVIVNEGWVEEKPPTKSAKTTMPKEKRKKKSKVPS